MEAFQRSDDYPIYKNIADHAPSFKASAFSKVPDYESLKKRLEHKTASDSKVVPNRWLLRIASIFILGLATYFFFLQNNEIRMETSVGQKLTVELPDESVVIVNALSDIRYSEKEWDKKRSLHLNGEAFFDVAKGATFDVKTPEGIITVVGTEFNVKQRGTTLEVVCYEGMVRVVSGEYTELLNAGQRLRLSKGKLLRGSSPHSNPMWTRSISDFQQVPFREVIEELERQYKIKVTLNKVPLEKQFTGGFSHENLENAIRAIAEPMDLEYKIDSTNEVTLSRREN
jgi:ferric-dicitrate binding protein FerR (iron transport regulator)